MRLSNCGLVILIFLVHEQNHAHTRSHWMWKTWQEATGIKKKLAKEDASVLGAFDFYRDKPGSDDGSGDAVLAHQLKCILLLDQTGKQ